MIYTIYIDTNMYIYIYVGPNIEMEKNPTKIVIDVPSLGSSPPLRETPRGVLASHFNPGLMGIIVLKKN